MATDTQLVSVMKFENSWLPWITLRHFLPASCVRSLCATMVHDMSGGLLSLEDLVEDCLGGGDAFLETWLIRPKVCSTPLANYLQQYVQRIVWQNDEESWYVNESLEKEAALPPRVLQFAFNLGQSDLLHVINALPGNDYIQAELSAVYDAILVCASRSKLSSPLDVEHLFKDIEERLTDVSSQLRIATFKHLGDLFCDRDRWEVASKLHEHAKAELEKLKGPEKLSDFASAMYASINQSLAASATITDGYGVGQIMLESLLNNNLDKHAMVLSNAGLDEYVTRVHSSENLFPKDTRSAMLIAPLLAESHSIERAFASWRAKKYPIAEGWFWSALRRQTALGLLAASKATKSQFGACLIDDLMSSKSFDCEKFKLAISLLIEGESSISAKEVRWSDDLLDACVDEAMCHFVIAHSEVHAGVLRHRRAVAVELFSEWACNIGVGREDLATLMLGYLISIGSDSKSNLRKDGADFQTCFEAVLNICIRRPEFRFGIRDELANVLAQRIGDTGYWTGEDVALRLAAECAPAFTSEGLKAVVTAVVALLKNTHPSDGSWVVVKPALRLLADGCVSDLAERNRDLGGDIVREILKFNNGESNGTYAADIIFALNRYPAALLNSQGIENQYKLLVKQALEKASAINASNAINNMMTLLVAPRVAGKEAIARTMEILGDILDSTFNGKSALSFGAAYTPIRYLVAYRSDICRESAMLVEDFDRSLAELSVKLQVVWDNAIEHPSIFSPLTLLRKQIAETTIVHNWVVASLELAESIDQSKAMLAKLEAARCQTQLSNGISLAFATRHASGAVADIDVKSMLTESRGAFYAAIGRRLSALQGNTDLSFKAALIKNTIRHGPRQVDAAVFASISPRDVDRLGNLIQDFEDYKARIGENRELSLTLLPLLDRWKEAMRA